MFADFKDSLKTEKGRARVETFAKAKGFASLEEYLALFIQEQYAKRNRINSFKEIVSF